MRAVYTAFVLSDPVTSPLPLLGLALPPVEWLLLWAAAVMLSRVALGKHFACDTLVGAAIGAFMALGTTLPTCDKLAWPRLLVAALFLAEAVACATMASLRRLMPAWWGMAGINVFYWATLTIAA